MVTGNENKGTTWERRNIYLCYRTVLLSSRMSADASDNQNYPIVSFKEADAISSIRLIRRQKATRLPPKA